MNYIVACLLAAAKDWICELQEVDAKGAKETFAFVLWGLIAAFTPIVIAVNTTPPNGWGMATIAILWIISYIIFNLIRRTYIRCKIS